MSSPVDVVLQFCESLEGLDFQRNRSLFAEAIADDCEWSNSGLPTASGREACLATFDGFNAAAGFVGLRVDMIAIGPTATRS